MKIPLKFTQLLLFTLNFGYIYSSPQAANFFNDCLGCLQTGNNFCMIIPSTQPGKCCVGMVSATDYCDPVYKWCTYSYPATSKPFMCPGATTCDNTVSVSDVLWLQESKTLADGELCVHRLKYDSIHMYETIYDLQGVSGDTSFRYTNMTKYVTIEVQVRVTTSSPYGTFYYAAQYLERPPTVAGVLKTLPLDTKFTLNIMNPYITIVVYSYGGPTTYTLEYGRLDNREFAGATLLKLSLLCAFLYSLIA